MECEVLGDACCKCPSLQFERCPCSIFETFKDTVSIIASSTEVLLCLRTDVQVLLSSSLLLLENDACELSELLDFSPSKLFNIALTESSESREEECTLQYWVVAWCSSEFANLFKSKIFSLDLLSLETLYCADRVYINDMLFKGMVYTRA